MRTRNRTRKRIGGLGLVTLNPNEGYVPNVNPTLPVLLFGGIGAIAAALAFVAYRNRGAIMSTVTTVAGAASGLLSSAFDFGKALAFQRALPSNVGQYAPQILAAARANNVSPWALAGIMYRESNGGDALTPKGAGGTGDFSKRAAGIKYVQPSGAVYTVDSSGLPDDGKGWGRGLMQIDYGVHNEWVKANAWWDPAVSLNKAAQLLRAQLNYFTSAPNPAGVAIDCWRINSGLGHANVQPWRTKYPGTQFPACTATKSAPVRDPRPLSGELLQQAALAAYNAGPSGVLQAVALGLPPEAVTANQNYVTWTMGKLASWTANF